MRILGSVLLVGGFLVRILSPPLQTLAWVLMGFGVVVVIISYLTKKK